MSIWSQPQQQSIPLLTTRTDDPCEDEIDPQLAESPRGSRLLRLVKTSPWISQCLYARINFPLVCVVLACSIMAAAGALFYKPREQSSKLRCTTSACLRAAAELTETLAPNYRDLDPCLDFHTYSCSGWDAVHFLREEQGTLYTGTVIEDDSDLIMCHILDKSLERSSDELMSIEQDNLEKARRSFRACLDEDAVAKKNVQPLADLVGELTDLFQRRTTDRNSIQTALGRALSFLFDIGVDALFRIDTTKDDYHHRDSILLIDLPLTHEWPSSTHYEDDRFIKDYATTIASVLEGLPLSSDSSNRPNSRLLSFPRPLLAASIVDFETQIAKAVLSARSSPVEKDRLRLNEVQDIIPNIDISAMVGALMGHSSPPETMLLIPSSYLQFVARIISRTSDEVLLAYLSWKVIQSYYPFVASPALRPLQDFFRNLAGQNPQYVRQRWRTCVKHVHQSLGWIVSEAYIKQTFPDSHSDFAHTIASEIQNELKTMIQKSEWVSERAREQSLDKVGLIKMKLGYPLVDPDLRSSESVQAYYAALKISSADYFGNAVASARFASHLRWRKIGTSLGQDQWDRTAMSANAYYNREKNEIVVPAGLMQEPAFYGSSVPSYLTFGAFGSVVGHELSHAFDSTGRRYGTNGSQIGETWDEKSATAFENRTSCFIRQYDGFIVSYSPSPSLVRLPPRAISDYDETTSPPILHVSGTLTLDENIADEVGLHASYLAWKKHQSRHSHDELLPGLEHFTPSQLFYLSYARYWCEKTRPKLMKWRLQEDPHAPGFARINGAVSNQRGFQEAFGCHPEKMGREMCTLWGT